MVFDLIGHQGRARQGRRLAELGRGEVGQADMAGEALFLGLVQRGDRLLERRRRLGPVQQQQVRRQAQADRRLFGLAQQGVAVEVLDPDLGGDEDLVAGHDPFGDGVGDAVAHGLLVLVDPGRVYVAIADAQGLMHHAARVLGFKLPGAESEKRNLHAGCDDGRLIRIGHGRLRVFRSARYRRRFSCRHCSASGKSGPTKAPCLCGRRPRGRCAAHRSRRGRGR
ncbi:hypothetical protein D3C80_1161670 [compost metagenome]